MSSFFVLSVFGFWLLWFGWLGFFFEVFVADLGLFDQVVYFVFPGPVVVFVVHFFDLVFGFRLRRGAFDLG